MATAHQLAVITNSCIKRPNASKDGLSTTWGERNYHVRANEDAEKDNDDQDDLGIRRNRTPESSVLFNKTDSALTDLTGDLGNLADDEFYLKLLELKEDHKKTLKMCESMYAERMRSKYSNEYVVNGQLGNTHNLKDPSFDDTLHLGTEMLGMNHDHIKDLSTSKKPPVARGRQRPVSAKAAFESSKSSKVMSSNNKQAWAHLTTSHIDDIVATRNELNSSMASKVDDMWDDFSVDDYAPRTRARSASLSRLSGSTPKKDKVSEWRHRITVPKPFKVAERTNSEKSKSKTLEEFERQREEKVRQEELECQKKFKATPVPAHVYMPLYDEITRKQEAQRRYNFEKCEEFLKSQEKPFQFLKREEERSKYRKSITNDMLQNETSPSKKKVFKAKPCPVHIFDGTLDDKVMEEEEYRRIRIKMRSEELLRNSSLPPNMKKREEIKNKRDGNYSDKARQFAKSEQKFHPSVNHEIPDFEELHDKFQKEMSSRKYQKEATVCKPFNLETARISKVRHKLYNDIAKDERSMRDSQWQFQSTKMNRSLSSSMDSIPTKMTQSAQLRASATKSKMQKQVENEIAEIEAARRRRKKEKELKRVIAERAAANDPTSTLQQTYKEKLREYRVSDRAREQEYRRQLEEIEERLGQRPLLFERTTQMNAKKAAERRFQETLHRAGLDENFITTKGSSYAGSMAADDYSDDDKEDDYSRHFSEASSRKSTSRSASKRYSGDDTDDASEVEED